jgi:hypothetical protein
MEILLGDFNAELGKENVFKASIGLRVYIGLVMLMALE